MLLRLAMDESGFGSCQDNGTSDLSMEQVRCGRTLAQSPDLNPIEDLQGEIAGTRPSCPTCLSSAKHCGKQSLSEEWKLLLLQRVGH